MKKLISIITFLSCIHLQSFGVECIQISHKDGANQYIRIVGEDGSTSNTHEFHLGAPETDKTKKLYAGYKLSYQKQAGKLMIEVTSNTFEGFIELDKGQYSPVITADHAKVELSKIGNDWIDIPLKGRAPIKIKWIDIENPANRI